MKKFLSLVLALVMTMSLVTISAGAKDFTDDSTINYAEAVDVMSAIGVVGGYADGSFNPQGGLTRGAAAKIICNMILGPTTAGALKADAAPYKDVAVDNTFAGYIAFCAKEGIISGYADGTFRPAAPLTGYAFMKMLLGALGYDAAIEGYTGANWSINVAKRALNIGLDKGLKEEFSGSKALNREEACLYAFNTLKADMVEYDTKGTQITINGVVIASGASEAKPVGGKKPLFMDNYFSKLHGDKDAEDAFGRPATKWTWKSKEVGTYADEADVSYTAQVKIKDIYSDLGLDKGIVADNVTVIVNGDGEDVDSFAITKNDKETKIGANGMLTEIFLEKKDKEDPDKITGAKVIEINTFIGEVVDVDEKDDERYIDIKSETLKDTFSYTTEEFEEDDIVLFTIANDEVQSVALAEKQTGTLTKTVGSKYTIDGETYSKSDKCEAGSLKVKEDVDFYLDSYGYVIKIDLTKDEITVDDLAYVLAAEDGGKLDDNRAKLLFADGSKKTVVTDEDYTSLEKSIVSFDVNDDDEYELSKITDQKPGTVTKGSPKFASGVTATSKTVYVYSVKDEDGKTSVDTYTGYKNAPTVKSGAEKVVAYYKDGKAVLVYVIANSEFIDDTSSNDKLTFIAVKANGDITNDGSNKYYSFSAVVDGEVTTLDIAANKLDGYTTGVYAFAGYKTNKDGIVTSLTVSDKLIDAGTTTIKTGDGVITLGTEPFAYTDDVLVLIVDDNEFDVSDVDSIKTKAGTYSSIQYTLDEGDIDVIILTKK